MLEYDAMMMPDGSVYRIPDGFEVPSEWNRTGILHDWTINEDARRDEFVKNGVDLPKQEWNKNPLSSGGLRPFVPDLGKDTGIMHDQLDRVPEPFIGSDIRDAGSGVHTDTVNTEIKNPFPSLSDLEPQACGYKGPEPNDHIHQVRKQALAGNKARELPEIDDPGSKMDGMAIDGVEMFG